MRPFYIDLCLVCSSSKEDFKTLKTVSIIDLFLSKNWVEKFLIQELKLGQVLVMDNASFHKSQKTRELIESVGCRIIFLPPYSPDLNPIEKFWANMKRWIKDKIAKIGQLENALEIFFFAPNPI